MRIRVKTWPEDEKDVQEVNNILAGKELQSIHLNIAGRKYNLYEAAGQLFVMADKSVDIIPSADNSFYIKYRDD